jgi:hypothetical protein
MSVVIADVNGDALDQAEHRLRAERRTPRSS